MSQPNSLPILNALLNRLSHSMLQYMGEVWPWTATADAPRQSGFMSLVEKQQHAAERLAGFLIERNVVLELRNYPFDGSMFHYCTLDFVMPRLIEDESRLLSDLKAASEAVGADKDAARLVQQLVAEEEQTLARLKTL